MKYSISFKEKAVRRILPPNNESVRSVSREIGVSENSIYIWLKKVKEGTLGKDGDVFIDIHLDQYAIKPANCWHL